MALFKGFILKVQASKDPVIVYLVEVYVSILVDYLIKDVLTKVLEVVDFKIPKNQDFFVVRVPMPHFSRPT